VTCDFEGQRATKCRFGNSSYFKSLDLSHLGRGVRFLNGPPIGGFRAMDCVPSGYLDDEGLINYEEEHRGILPAYSLLPIFSTFQFNGSNNDTVGIYNFQYGATGHGVGTLDLFNLSTGRHYEFNGLNCGNMPQFLNDKDGYVVGTVETSNLYFLGSPNFAELRADIPLSVTLLNGNRDKKKLISFYQKEFPFLLDDVWSEDVLRLMSMALWPYEITESDYTESGYLVLKKNYDSELSRVEQDIVDKFIKLIVYDILTNQERVSTFIRQQPYFDQTLLDAHDHIKKELKEYYF